MRTKGGLPSLSSVSAALLLFSGLALVASPARAVTTTTVTVQNEFGLPLPGVQVLAVTFPQGQGPGQSGPDAVNSKIGVTFADGTAVFALTDNLYYQIVVSSQGFLPSLRDQLNNPDPNTQHFFYTTGISTAPSIGISSAGVSNMGTVSLAFANASANSLLFGGVNINGDTGGGNQIGMGLALTDGVGGGTLTVNNIPYAPANTYGIGLYDPQKNQGVGRGVNIVLNSGSPSVLINGPQAADFNQQGIPPPRVDNTALQQGGGGAVNVQGAVVDTTTAHNPIPNIGISFQSANGGAWTQADQNGSFTLSNLVQGTTYYAQIFGGCTFGPNGPGACYSSWVSPALSGSSPQYGNAPGANDFVYNDPTTVLSVRIQLNKAPPSTGVIPVYVQDSSNHPMYNVGVNLQPDYSPWHGGSAPNCASNTTIFNPGLANAQVQATTGYALLTGLPSGNYMVQVWTPFSSQDGVQANAGPDGTVDFGGGGPQPSAHCGSDSDDLRISIDTTATPSLQVFNSSGTNLNISSITVTINTDSNASGEVKGMLTFSQTADLTQNPLTIILAPNCSGPCNYHGNFTVIQSSGSSQYPYLVKVSSGASYFVDVRAANWGLVRTQNADNNVNLALSSSQVVNMAFAPAGDIIGKVYKPDGSLLQPSNGQFIGIDANSNGGNSFGHANLNNDGSYEIDGLLPGLYSLHLEAGGGQQAFTYTLPNPPPSAVVVAGSSVTADINLVSAIYLGINLSTGSTFDPVIVSTPIGNFTQITYGFEAKLLPHGRVIGPDVLLEMLQGSQGGPGFSYALPTSSSTYSSCGLGWPGGFCAMPFAAPAAYDVLLIKRSDFGPGNFDNYQHFVVVNSTNNIVLDSSHATTLVPTGSSFDFNSHSIQVARSSGVLVDLTPNPSQAGRGLAALKGSLAAANFLRQQDFSAMGGDFQKFMKFVPIVALYDPQGNLAGAGMVTPSPSYIGMHNSDFQNKVGSGFQDFSNLLNGDPAGFGYAIRDLAPNTCYTEVVTTPNYPPFTTQACLGASGSTTTVNVNLDSAVGAGATLQGVIETTAAVPVPIAGAEVDISGDGFTSKSAVTGALGAYSFPALPAGTIKVKVSAQGYALAKARVNVAGTAAITQNFQLFLGPGSISGTVYSQKFPFAKVQPGAYIYAYDDTFNGNNPGAALPLYKTKTGSDGTYLLSGLIRGDTYKVFLKVPGKYILSASTTATGGLVSGIDFTMQAKPLDVDVFARQTDTAFEFTIHNPKDFKSGRAWIGTPPFDVNTSTEVSNQVQPQPDNELLLRLPIAGNFVAGTIYILHIDALSTAGKEIVKEIKFGLGYAANVEQEIDQSILGDDSDDGTGRHNNDACNASVTFPTGVAQAASASVPPSCASKGHKKNDPEIAAKANAIPAGGITSDVYDIKLSSVSLNPNRCFNVTLPYDKSATNLSDAGIGRFNSTTGKWEKLSGVTTVDPTKGTISGCVTSLSGAQALRSSSSLFSRFNGQEYVLRPEAAGGGSSDSGTFAVVKLSALTTGDAFAGSQIKIFNFPNPFNLSSKTLTLAHNSSSPSHNTTATTIRFDLPAADGGHVILRIYTVSGELVRELDQGNLAGGAYYYVDWDGNNADGQPVANGVYYGVLTAPGVKTSDATFKMAVIK